MSMYDCIFQCELSLILSQVLLKRGRAELHIDTKSKTKNAEITDTEIISCVWLMSSLTLGHICNTQNSTVALDPRVGKYQNSDPAESRVFQDHLASTSTL